METAFDRNVQVGSSEHQITGKRSLRWERMGKNNKKEKAERGTTEV